MRILVASNVPVDTCSGSGYVINGYAEGLRARGHEVTVLDPRHFRFRGAGFTRARRLFGYTHSVAQAARCQPYDVIELWGAEGWRSLQVLRRQANCPALVARSNGLEPHRAEIMERHGVEIPWRRATVKRRLGGYLFDAWQKPEALFRGADMLTVVSQSEARYAAARHYQTPDRLSVFENPLPDSWLRAEVPSTRRNIVGFVGHWLPVKGVHLLCDFMKLVLRDNPTWVVRFTGVGALSRDLLGAEFSDRVEIVPFETEKGRLRASYLETAIAVVPSWYESFGLVIAEAMACGCAVVSARVGFADDLRDDEEAVLLASRNPEDWRLAINRLIRDCSSRRRIAVAGHARVQRLRWDDAITELENAYAALVRRIGGRS